MRLLLTILRQNLRAGQLLGFFFANLIGGLIVLVGVLSLCNVNRFLHSDDGLFAGNYMVLTKPVSTISTIGSFVGAKPGFSESEIQEISSLPSVRRVGTFERAQCEVYASITAGELAMSTDMFLESVPDEFIDVNVLSEDGLSTRWDAGFQDTQVPVIVPRNYLNLYNYGFAASRDMPVLSEGLMTSFPFDLYLTDSRSQRTIRYNARVIGFSNRINTILVPRKFLREVNQELGDQKSLRPSRLIIETDMGSSADDLLTLLREKGYVSEGDSDALRLQTILHVIFLIIISIGVIISLLSFYLLSISISLLTERNKEKFRNLYTLGFTLSRIARPYRLLVVLLDAMVWIVSLLLGLWMYSRLVAMLQVVSPAFSAVSSWWMALLAAGLMLLFMGLHFVLVTSSIRRQLPR